MKRDMDVIRKILLASAQSEGSIKQVEGIDSDVFGFHAHLLVEAGLAHCSIQWDEDSREPRVYSAVVWRLTWQGFDFADSVADDGVWRKAKENVLKPAVSWSFGVLSEYLKQEALRQLGIGSGP